MSMNGVLRKERERKRERKEKRKKREKEKEKEKRGFFNAQFRKFLGGERGGGERRHSFSVKEFVLWE